MFSGTGTSGNQNRIDIYSLSSGVIRCDMYNSSGSPTVADSAAVLAADGLYTVALVYNALAPNLQWYVNGVASGSPVTPGARTGAGASYTFGGNIGGQPANQDYSLLAVIQGAPPPSRLVDIHRNPWQLFAPQRTPVFYSIAGVSPGPSTANRIMLLRRPGLSRVWR